MEVKGGISDATLRRIIRMENDLRRSGTYGIGEDSGGCSECDSRRCNGAAHSSTNVRAGAYAATGGGLFSTATGGNPLTAIGSFVIGSLSDFFMDNQMGEYYDNYSTQGSGSKVDIWADSSGYNNFPNTFGGMHNSGCGGN